jgi:uncharacterized phage protein (TIGR01671 family)
MKNREIKFRVWDNIKKEYFKPTYEAYKGNLEDLSIGLSGDITRRTLEFPAEHESRFPNQYILEQFTGLKDKNGVEIYENDIVKRSETEEEEEFSGMVRYYNLEFTTIDYDNNNWLDGKECVLAFDTGIIEVIGNIHENKNLLLKK